MHNTTLPKDQGSTEDLLKKMGQSKKDPLEKLGYLNTPEELNAKRDIKATTDNGTVDVSQLDPNLLESDKITVESAEAVVEQTGEQAQIEPENASELNNDEISESTEPTEEAPVSQAIEAPNDKAQTVKKEGDEGSKETEKEEKSENKPEGEESNNPDAAKKEGDKPKDDKSSEASSPTQNNSGEAKPAGPDDSSKKGAQSRAHAEDEAARVEKGKSKLGSAINKVRNADGDDLGEKAKNAAEQEAKQVARRAIAKKLDPAKQAAKQAVRTAGAAIKKAAVSFLANPYVLGAIGVIILIVVIVSVVFSLFAFSSENGGPAVYPNTEYQAKQTTLLSGLAGNKIAQNELVISIIGEEKERYQQILENAKKYSPELTDTINATIPRINQLLDEILAQQTTEKKLDSLKIAEAEMKAFEATMPFGIWIKEIAVQQVGKPNLEFCKITKASSRVACASFTSTVLAQAGVPNAIVATTASIWNAKSLSLVVDRLNVKDERYYAAKKGSLKPGDIIWWGDGKCSSVRYSGKIFDHVGIYVGNDEAVDTSSKEGVVKKRPVTGRGCWAFNGAKRYGS